MGAQRIVRAALILAVVEIFRLHPRIDMAAPEMPRPAIMRAPAHLGQIVRHHVAAQHVALVDHRVEFVGAGQIGHAHRIAHAVGIDDLLVGREFDLQYRRPLLFNVHAVFADIAVRADRDVEIFPVPAGEQIAGPVIVRGPGIEIGDLAPFGGDHCITLSIGIGIDRIGIGDIERVVDQFHAERGVEIFQKGEFLVDRTVLVAVAQQADPVGGFTSCPGLAHQIAHDPAFDSLVGSWRAVGLGDQDIAIGQPEHAPRMIQSVGKTFDDKTFGRNRFLALVPGLRLGDIDGRECFLADIAQRRFDALGCLERQLGGIAAGKIISCTDPEDDEQNRYISDMFQHEPIIGGVKGPDKRGLK